VTITTAAVVTAMIEAAAAAVMTLCKDSGGSCY
jgi:hypothetical protein